MARIPTFVVSLPGDEDRLEALRAQLDTAYFDLHSPNGFLGRTLPDIVCLRLTRDPNSVNNKGALGVMMSHILIWERVALLDAPFALVLEDDVTVSAPEQLVDVALPDDFDFIFCGDQSAVGTAGRGHGEDLDYRPALDALPAIEARRVSVGAYGYLLSPQGARNLLRLFEEHFYFGHVDVRMLAYCCNSAELDGLGPLGRLTEELRGIRRIIDDPPKLSGFATIQPVVTHVGMTSRREREDALGLTQGRQNTHA